MVKRWIIFLAALLGCIIFVIAYDGWLAWLLLAALVCLPLLSVLLSIPPVLTTQIPWLPPQILEQNARESFAAVPKSPLPLPPCRVHLQVRHNFTGKTLTLYNEQSLPTDHCGILTCTPDHWHMEDYLGLFRLKLRQRAPVDIVIRPTPIPVALNDTVQQLAQSWMPKSGGGFSENHDLRLYRPGDSINQIHWKLTAKTGKAIVREPIIPRAGKNILTLSISGTAAQLDKKMGQLLWMGRYLLEKGLLFEIHAATGDGIHTHTVGSEATLLQAIDQLLAAATTVQDSTPELPAGVSFHYHIGGDGNET